MLKTTAAKLVKHISFSGENTAQAVQSASVTKLKQVATASKPEVITLLKTKETGLSTEEKEEREQEFGLNEVSHEKAPSWYLQLLEAFLNPFIGVLIIIAAISIITDIITAAPGERDYKTVTVVGVMVLLSSFLRFWQEFRSNKAAEQLKSMVKTTATVLRNGEGKKEVDIKDLTVGDVVLLSAGDMIPADCRVWASKDLFVSQAMLTGESLPVEKRDISITDAEQKSPLELENICFMGTNVVSGAATVIVVNIGNQTYFGSISKSLTGKRAETSFDKGVNSVSWL
ncbi:MAG: HAD-IC family P-type ATPase, partial [Hydrotalea flava]|nr:HAD-IC family P-type ATPase [Hydrotalea flava]NIM36897.1 HAD-IC family P-type ATPase [Hydrotalea flava]NIN02089.1 HAD-IC family P-type ATPase [Hydrotalea flava]NIN13742.1 HAD-IC family P-type ATPase [Hydrotalea flava]NIO92823.1 HAD-IC family P-type ATPase [Hydrotalea flava]